MDLTREEQRLRDARTGTPWRFWGPYLSERQWGTVREDYSDNGDAWSYFSHDQARSRAYRWGEDGLAGISDEHQRLCFALALWNEQDADPQGAPVRADQQRGQPRRGRQGVLLLRRQPADALATSAGCTSTRSAPFPYADLIDTNRSRSRFEMEYELLDTGIFDEDRYFDVEVTYAKAGPHDLLCRIDVHNRGPEDAPIHLLPTMWFRNTWTFQPHTAMPTIERVEGRAVARAEHDELGRDAPVRGRGRRAAVLRQRVQRRPSVGRRGLAAVPEGRHRRPRPARHADRQPRWQWDQGGRPLRLVVPAGGSAGTWAAPDHGRPGRC